MDSSEDVLVDCDISWFIEKKYSSLLPWWI